MHAAVVLRVHGCLSWVHPHIGCALQQSAGVLRQGLLQWQCSCGGLIVDIIHGFVPCCAVSCCAVPCCSWVYGLGL
jgi:hypothetical protein